MRVDTLNWVAMAKEVIQWLRQHPNLQANS